MIPNWRDIIESMWTERTLTPVGSSRGWSLPGDTLQIYRIGEQEFVWVFTGEQADEYRDWLLKLVNESRRADATD